MRTLSLLLLTATGLPAQAADWSLLRGISPGQAVHVHMLDGRQNRGGFISTTESDIVIRQRTGDQTFTKKQIRKVSVRTAGKRWRNAGIGAAAGAVIGIGIGCNDAYFGCAIGAAALGAFYAIVGGAVGALVPGYKTLYRAPRN